MKKRYLYLLLCVVAGTNNTIFSMKKKQSNSPNPFVNTKAFQEPIEENAILPIENLSYDVILEEILPFLWVNDIHKLMQTSKEYKKLCDHYLYNPKFNNKNILYIKTHSEISDFKSDAKHKTYLFDFNDKHSKKIAEISNTTVKKIKDWNNILKEFYPKLQKDKNVKNKKIMQELAQKAKKFFGNETFEKNKEKEIEIKKLFNQNSRSHMPEYYNEKQIENITKLFECKRNLILDFTIDKHSFKSNLFRVLLKNREQLHGFKLCFKNGIDSHKVIENISKLGGCVTTLKIKTRIPPKIFRENFESCNTIEKNSCMNNFHDEDDIEEFEENLSRLNNIKELTVHINLLKCINDITGITDKNHLLISWLTTLSRSLKKLTILGKIEGDDNVVIESCKEQLAHVTVLFPDNTTKK